MYFSNVILVAGALVPLVSAHGGDGIPHIVGLNVKDLKGRDMLSNLKSRIAAAKQEAHGEIQGMERRQDDKRCGAQYGSCAAGECCSGSGWCGTTADYCYSPGCDWKYGPGCNENKTPKGLNTSTIARPKNGNVPYGGGGIYSCNKAGTIALTFDDGPFKGYTSHILDLFKSYNAKGTFFITGANINKGQIDETPEHADVIKRMHAEGHQIASHTWTHLDLDKITPVERKNQMWKLEMAIRNIVGFFPTYMRPPYSSCGPASGCEKDMADLGYHISYFDVDTDDYNQLTKENIQKSKDWFKGNITANNAKPATHDWLGIAHDIHELTAYNLTEYMLKTLTDLGYKAVTMGECLNDPKENWYRGGAGGSPTTTRTSTAPSSTSTKKVSTDATCGGTKGFTCQGSTFGNCCSAAGWCGSTTDYCGTGCQPAFGTCSSTPASSTKPPTPSSTTKVSQDGTCGGTNKFTCQGSTFGNCCSSAGWCGTSSAHCGTGCQTGFGTCGGTTVSSSKAPTPTPTGAKVSTDGTCAGTNKFTCQGSTFGNCCSQYGWCGSTTGHCGTGCNRSYGTCS